MSPTTLHEKDSEEKAECRQDQSFSEGGYRGWATVLGAFCAQFCGFGYTSSFGIYQDYYVRIYMTERSASAISWIGSVNAFLVISTGLVAGRLYDRGHFHLLVFGGSFLTCFSLFMLSLAKTNQYYQVFLCQGIGLGIGAGMIYVPSMAIVSHYFEKHSGLTMSIVTAGSSLGAIIHPIMLNNTLNNPNIGFAAGTRASAWLVTGMLTIACLLMRPRYPAYQITPGVFKSLRRMSSDSPYILATFGFTFLGFGFYYPLFYLQLSAIKHGLPKEFAFYSLVILSFSSFIGRISCGFFARTLGVGNMITVSTGCCAALIFAMIGIQSIASVVIIGVFYGFSSGSFIALMGPLMKMLTDDPNELGLRMGVSFAISGIGDLTGTPITGALLTDKYIWWRPTFFSGSATLLGNICFLTMYILFRRRQRRNDETTAVSI